MAKFKVELEFHVDKEKIGKYMLGYYLERNMCPIVNTIFEDWNDDDSPRDLGFVPDEVCSFDIINIEEIKED